MLNHIVLIGRLVRDVDMRYTNNGTPVANFTLAVERGYQSKDGDKEVDYIKIVTWRKLAENCAKHIGKGRLVAVEGSLQIRKSKGKDGKQYINPEVIANNVKFLDWPDSKGKMNDNYKEDEEVAKEVEENLDDDDFEVPFQEVIMKYDHTYLWNEIKQMYSAGNLKGEVIEKRDDFPSRTWIYKLFGNMKTIKDSIEKELDTETAKNRDNIRQWEFYNYDYVIQRLRQMAANDELTAENVKQDDTLPSVSNIWRRIGSLKSFQNKKHEINDICTDCLHEFESCGKDKEQCEQEYNEMWGDQMEIEFIDDEGISIIKINDKVVKSELQGEFMDKKQHKLEYSKIKENKKLAKNILENDFYYVKCFYCENKKICKHQPGRSWICEKFKYVHHKPIEPPVQDTCGGYNGWDLTPDYQRSDKNDQPRNY